MVFDLRWEFGRQHLSDLGWHLKRLLPLGSGLQERLHLIRLLSGGLGPHQLLKLMDRRIVPEEFQYQFVSLIGLHAFTNGHLAFPSRCPGLTPSFIMPSRG